MAKEIERKYLGAGDKWRTEEYSDYVQEYLSIDKARTVRVRLAGDLGSDPQVHDHRQTRCCNPSWIATPDRG